MVVDSNANWGWAASLANFDLGGWEDLFASNGCESNCTDANFLAFAGDKKIQASKSQTKIAIVDLAAE